VKESFEAETRDLEEIKNTFTEENLLTDLSEKISTPSEAATETSASAEPPIPAETMQGTLPLFFRPAETSTLEATSPPVEGEQVEKEKKEEPEGAKEEVPSHG